MEVVLATEMWAQQGLSQLRKPEEVSREMAATKEKAPEKAELSELSEVGE